ncbi:MAG: phosphatidate cytidylyltransferase [Akkermansia sp.]|nr:phosphatidate cytidylyltransferase [Akkermansia sp.]MCD8071325.1 phosphatidate cytidylyltransferase [Akkermansiaceae bacterium]
MSPKIKTFCERLFSTAILLLLLGAALLWGEPAAYALFVCILCNLTTIEWFNMLKKRPEQAQRRIILIAGLLYPWAQWLSLEQTRSRAAFFALALAFPVFLTIVSLIREMAHPIEGDRALKRTGTTLTAFLYPVWMFAFTLPFIFSQSLGIMLALVLITKLTDIFAYVSGVLCGGRIFAEKSRIIPHISPKKTWEGLLGSFILTAAAGYFLLKYLCGDVLFPAPPWAAAAGTSLLILPAIYMLLFILAVTGDLAGSLIKRSLNVKDSGSLLPGIGGIFDLIDSPAFTVSAFCILFMLTGQL